MPSKALCCSAEWTQAPAKTRYAAVPRSRGRALASLRSSGGCRMAAIGGVLAWCRRQRSNYLQHLELLESGYMTTGEKRGLEMVDTTAQTIEQVRRWIADLDALLAEFPARKRAKR